MISIAALRAMAKAGCSMEQIIDFVEAEQNATLEKEARAREGTRVRVEKHRARKRQAEIERALRLDPTGEGIPKGWRPNMDGLMRADMMGMTQEQTNLEIERFREYYLGTGKVRADWNAAFRSWLISPYFAKGSSNGKPKEHYLDLWDAAYAKLEAHARGGRGHGPPPAAPIHPKVRR